MDQLTNAEVMSVSSGLTSLSFDSTQQDQDNLYAVSGSSLLDRLDLDDLKQLKAFFFPNDRTGEKQRRISSFQNKLFYGGIPLTKEEFVNAVNIIIGSGVYSLAAANLFENLSKHKDEAQSNVIWWVQILDSMIEDWNNNQSFQMHLIEDSVIISSAEHSKRETIVKIIPVETEQSFSYVIICKYGRVGIYDRELKLLDSYMVALAKDNCDEVQKISTTCWVTDAIYLEDAVVLLIAASNCSLHLFDISGLIHVPVVTITGMPYSPSCLYYCKGLPSLLFIGDDHGDITTLSFFKPKHSLFCKNTVDESSLYFWTELSEQSEYLSISVKSEVHSDTVQRIYYCSNNRAIVSCSLNGETSLVIQHFNSQRLPYIFKLSKGVKCFDLNQKLRLLVTGSSDNIVRVWNPVVPKLPISCLQGHKEPIVDVTFLHQSKTIISFSADGVLKDWDIDKQCCVQTIDLNFPAFSIPGKLVEFGKRSIYTGPPEKDPPLLRQPKSGLMTMADISTLEIDSSPSKDNEKKSGKPEDMKLDSGEIGVNSSILIVCSNNIALVRLIDETDEEIRASSSEADPMPRVTNQRTKTEQNKDQQLNLPSSFTAVAEESKGKIERVKNLIGKRATEILPLIRRQTPSSASLNFNRVEEYCSEKQVQFLVEQCTPHLALKLSDLEQLQMHFQPPKNCSNRLQACLKISDVQGSERGSKVVKKLDRHSITPSRVSSCSLTSHITAPSI